jgi:HSP20 family protein
MNRIVRYTYPRSTSALAQGNPWSGLESQIDRLFQATVSDFVPALSPRFPVDLYEDKDNAYVRAELPGISRENLNIEMVDGFLNISATRKDGEQTFTLNRSVSIPESVQADKVSATSENGVLTVTLPKQEQAKPRKINIAVS